MRFSRSCNDILDAQQLSMKTALEQNIRAIENMRVVLKGLVEKTRNTFDDIYGSSRVPATGAYHSPVEP